MNTTTIAMQELMVQPQPSQNGVVNIASEEQGQEKSFNQIFKKLMQGDAKQEISESILEQALKRNGEEDAAELAAQLMAQNPIIAMLLANNNLSSESMQAVLSQLTQSAQTLQAVGTQPLQAVGTQLQQAVSTQPLQDLSAQELLQQAVATTQSAMPQEVATTFETIMQANTQVAQATQMQAATTQAQLAAQQNVAAQPSQSNAEDVAIISAKPLADTPVEIKVTSTTQKPEQAQQLAEKADFEAIAQKLKLDVATAQQGSTQQESKEGESEEGKANVQAKQAEGKTVISDEQAIQATFDKQLASVQTVKPEELTVKANETKEIIRQTAEGIKANIATGKEEFVMKLSPQGLGEITVKLVSENGRTVMQLTAQNQNVQRILGAELEALRQAVRPYNVEVKEVNTANQSQLDMSNQSSSQQQYQSNASSFFFNQQQGRHHAQQGYTSYNQPTDLASDDSIIPQQITLAKAINLHI